jgi:FtsZ-binding cell division protein ZapB
MTTRKKTSEQMLLSGTEEEIFKRLHERVEKAMTVIQDLRRERDALKAKLAAAEDSSALKEDFERMQKERNEIRSRIETILSNLESLDASSS